MKVYSAALFAAIVVAACSSPTATNVPAPLSALPANGVSQAVSSASQFLYVASAKGGVSVYPLGGTAPVRTLSQGVDLPTAMAFDKVGNLFVANHDGGPSGRGFISVFAPGATTPERKISNGVNVPYSLAFDSKGNLYVANYIRALSAPKLSNGSVTVYKPNADAPFRTITGVDHPHQIAVDSRDDLYVAEVRYLQAYAPGATSPARILASYPFALATDSKDRLYAGLWGECPNYCFGGIDVFVPGKKKPVAWFGFDGSEAPATDVTGFAFDSLGDFVFSATNAYRPSTGGPPHFGGGVPVSRGAVGVYPTLRHHGGRKRYWITSSYNLAPSAVVVDSSDDIIVGSNGSVVAFADFKPNSPQLYAITQGVAGQVTALLIASQ